MSTESWVSTARGVAAREAAQDSAQIATPQKTLRFSAANIADFNAASTALPGTVVTYILVSVIPSLPYLWTVAPAPHRRRPVVKSESSKGDYR